METLTEYKPRNADKTQLLLTLSTDAMNGNVTLKFVKNLTHGDWGNTSAWTSKLHKELQGGTGKIYWEI